jgi:FtsH-binding integral membrane protein
MHMHFAYFQTHTVSFFAHHIFHEVAFIVNSTITRPPPQTAIVTTYVTCATRTTSAFMASDKQEMGYTLVFGIAGVMIASTALFVAYLQLKARRVQHVHLHDSWHDPRPWLRPAP